MSKRKKNPELKRNIKYTVRYNGYVTSVSIKISVVSLFLTLSECEIDPHAFMKRAIRGALSDMTVPDNKYLSELVTYKLLESLMDKEDVARFYKFAARLT